MDMVKVNGLAALTVGNPKIMKNQARGVLTGVQHLLPATEYPRLAALRGEATTLRTLCPFAGACAAPCLNTAGRGGIPQGRYAGTAFSNGVQHGRYKRTRRYDTDREAYLTTLLRDIDKVKRAAAAADMDAAVRLNGTSDVDWEREHPDVVAHAAAQGVTLYDYTKDAARVRRGGYVHQTYSLDAGAAREIEALRLLRDGFNVAVVFNVRRGADLPATWRGFAVIDGDETDLRYTDPRGVVVGLRAKGRAINDCSGFVRDAVTGDAVRAAAAAIP